MFLKLFCFSFLIVLFTEKVISATSDQHDDVIKETSDETRDKRHVGRWKNFRYRLSSAAQDGRDEHITDIKRHIGRWKNFNWKLSSKTDSDNVEKRFFGRLMNLQNHIYNTNMQRRYGLNIPEKRFFGRWKNFNYLASGGEGDKRQHEFYPFNLNTLSIDKDLMREIGDINNMGK